MIAIARIQPRGRVTIPTRLREQAGLSKGDLVELSFRRGKIVLTPKGTVAPSRCRWRVLRSAAPEDGRPARQGYGRSEGRADARPV
ncbi:MAG: AbrB/MazE/SpoVT family DNA-binding domain-containing protein [Bryobacteraceae bacterium]